MVGWTDLGFRESWTNDHGDLRGEGFPLQVFDVYPRISEVLCGLFIGWEEDVAWWRQALDALPPDTISRTRIQVVHHQNSGTACRPFAGQIIPLTIASQMMDPVVELCRRYYGSNDGAWTLPHKETDLGCHVVNEYRRLLFQMGLTADLPLTEVREGVYPLDASPPNFERLLEDQRQVVKAMEVGKAYSQAADSLRMFILADNSD